MNENKKIRKRAINAIDDIKNIREKEERKLEKDSLCKKEEGKDGELINPTADVQNLIGEGHFILVKVKKSSNGDYIKY